MSKTNNEPLINKTAYNCPHCGAYTTQYWYQIYTESYKKGMTPIIPPKDYIEKVKANPELEKESKENLIKWVNQMLTRKPFFESDTASHYGNPIIYNLNISKCNNCNDIAIWVHDQLVYPSSKIEINPNDDLPDQVKQLFN